MFFCTHSHRLWSLLLVVFLAFSSCLAHTRGHTFAQASSGKLSAALNDLWPFSRCMSLGSFRFVSTALHLWAPFTRPQVWRTHPPVPPPPPPLPHPIVPLQNSLAHISSTKNHPPAMESSKNKLRFCFYNASTSIFMAQCQVCLIALAAS